MTTYILTVHVYSLIHREMNVRYVRFFIRNQDV